MVACHKFVEVNAFGLAVAALSSYDSNMRSAAYYVLGSFRSHMEGAQFREQRQVRICLYESCIIPQDTDFICDLEDWILQKV